MSELIVLNSRYIGKGEKEMKLKRGTMELVISQPVLLMAIALFARSKGIDIPLI